MMPARSLLAALLIAACTGVAPIPCFSRQAAAAEQPPASAQPGAELLSPLRIPGRSLERSQFAGNATVITREEISRSGALSVPELLARTEGVSVMDTRGFGLGADTSLNLRGVAGGSRSNVLVLLDGVRQNSLTGDEVHWQAIPLDQVERIEILRGGSGVIYGEGALAGVINIVTAHDRPEPLAITQTAEIGTHGWRKYAASFRGRSEPLGYGASVTRRLLDGYREFSSSRSTTLTGYSGLQVLPDLRLDFQAVHAEDTSAFPGGLTPQQSQDRNQQAVISRVGIFEDLSDQVSLDLTVGPHDGLTWLLNTYWRDREMDSLRSGLFTFSPSRGLNLRSSYEWTGPELSHTFVSGFELADDKASTGTRGTARTDESNRSGYGVYMQETLALDRLSLTGAFRYDRSRFEEDIVAFDSSFNEVNYVGTLHFEGKSPMVGFAYQLVPKACDVFANFSRPFKAPNVDDFASRSSEYQGNVSLQPQQADAYEAGVRGQAGPWTWNATGFAMRIDEEILFVQGVPGNPFIFQNQNHDTRRYGLETAARFELPERGLKGSLAYTFVDAEFRKGQFRGRTIPGTAEHTLNAGLGYSPLPSFWVMLDWQLVHDVRRINDVSNALPEADNYGVLDLRLSYDLRAPGARAYLTLKNLTGEEYETFPSSNGHTMATGAGENPMPPLHVIGGLTVEF